MIKKILFIGFVLILIVIAASVYFYKYDEIHKIDKKEAIAYTHLRLIKTELAYDGNISEQYTAEEMNLLENMAKRVNPKLDWFSSNSGVFYVNTADTSDYKITWISDGTYYATFYVKNDKSINNTLVKCTFLTGTEKGYQFYIK